MIPAQYDYKRPPVPKAGVLHLNWILRTCRLKRGRGSGYGQSSDQDGQNQIFDTRVVSREHVG